MNRINTKANYFMEKAYFIKKEFHLKEKMTLFKCID